MYDDPFVEHRIDLTSSADPKCHSTQSGLTAFFGFEVLLRLWVHRLFFFCNDAWKWSVFDLVLVAQSCFDLVSDMVVDDEPSKGNISFLRTLRLLRLARAHFQTTCRPPQRSDLGSHRKRATEGASMLGGFGGRAAVSDKHRCD